MSAERNVRGRNRLRIRNGLGRFEAQSRSNTDRNAVISAKSRIGRIRRAIRRAFIVSDGQPLTTTEILRRAYPRFKCYPSGHRHGLRRALRQEAIAIARMRLGRGRPCLWLPLTKQKAKE
jgi:hypothetical protein